MRDFILFLRELFRILYFIRGILAMFALLMLFCVVGIAVAEGLRIGHAAYFVLITALTIGYGDITPSTGLGRVVSVTAGVLGMLANGIVVAVAVRALAMAFRDRIQEHEATWQARRGHAVKGG